MKTQNAYCIVEGREARRYGTPALGNPYDKDQEPVLARSWIMGWMLENHALRTGEQKCS